MAVGKVHVALSCGQVSMSSHGHDDRQRAAGRQHSRDPEVPQTVEPSVLYAQMLARYLHDSTCLVLVWHIDEGRIQFPPQDLNPGPQLINQTGMDLNPSKLA